MDIGKNIREIRKKRNLSQRELGELLGVTQSAVGQFEKNGSNLRAETIQRIAAALGVLPGDLLQDGIYPTSEEMAAIHAAHEAAKADPEYNERQAEIEEKRLNSLIRQKAELLNSTGKQKTVDYMADLSENPKYQK